MLWCAGEAGKNYDLTMEVLSFSVEEDWITGVARIPVTYSAPYAGIVPVFPAGDAMYAASTATSSTAQPYSTIPWEARFVGCCRTFQVPTALGSARCSEFPTRCFEFGGRADAKLADPSSPPAERSVCAGGRRWRATGRARGTSPSPRTWT